ncbi:MAG: tRNA (guanosine(37)-N1)-methyltransferase TrmD [Candidatus Poribacteria bacterium]|nr:tRNA (guanosine(37)-N1)-methyltransferase TrmD [Candidatus Poribacteria bacterium]MDE0504965.1 tRNA (guanosine(37)-N1)-methyltransferase TrmD [Candidatus Poribacteria bacterium]
MKIDVIALFPEIIIPALQVSILKRAQEAGHLTINVHNLRDFATGRHQSVDDYPYGGGAGMILKPEPLFAAVRALSPGPDARVIFLTPQGKPCTQRIAEALSLESHIILICGRYKGIDERVRQKLVTDEISIGDYVLSGGEIPALVLIDTIGRVLPGVLGDYESAQDDSFSQHLLDHPHYTRPADFEGMKVPEVLLTGHHEKISRWKYEESLRRTGTRRPDLLENIELTEEDTDFLNASCTNGSI